MPKLTNAHKIGAVAIACAVILAAIDWRLVWIPIVIFLFFCAAAPFCYRFGFYLPLISRGRSGRPIVALTFDDGPHPATTPGLLDLLDQYGVKATFFVLGRRAKNHPDLIRQILSRGHTIGNHSYNHDAFIAFKGARQVGEEITTAQRLLMDLGAKPLVYRPPVGITYPALNKVLNQLGMVAVTFSCRARDRGNRCLDHLSERILKCVRGDDIVMLHDHLPGLDDQAGRFFNEITRILEGIRSKGLSIQPLEDVIGRPVTVTLPPADRNSRTSG